MHRNVRVKSPQPQGWEGEGRRGDIQEVRLFIEQSANHLQSLDSATGPHTPEES